MTDKQIIIDGCNVSGCDRLNTFPMQYGKPHEICLTSLEQWGGQEKYCKDRPNCYYKQLKRKEGIINILEQECTEKMDIITALENKLKAKEQECEKWKEYFKTAKEASNCNLQALGEMTEWADKLDEENDQLKEQLDQLKAENESWQKEYWKLEQGNDFLAEKNSKLRGCLTEIKEIAETASKCLYATISDDYTEGYRWLGSIILQKISEVEE